MYKSINARMHECMNAIQQQDNNTQTHKEMKNIEVNEIYTLFEEIRELIKYGSKNNAPIQPKIELTRLVGYRRIIRQTG